MKVRYENILDVLCLDTKRFLELIHGSVTVWYRYWHQQSVTNLRKCMSGIEKVLGVAGVKQNHSSLGMLNKTHESREPDMLELPCNINMYVTHRTTAMEGVMLIRKDLRRKKYGSPVVRVALSICSQ